MPADKLRVHNLAQTLGVASKDIIAKCKAEGITDLKNHMSVVKLGLAESIREWFSVEADITSVEGSAPVDLATLKKRRRPRKKTAEADSQGAEVAVMEPPADAGADAEAEPPPAGQPAPATSQTPTDTPPAESDAAVSAGQADTLSGAEPEWTAASSSPAATPPVLDSPAPTEIVTPSVDLDQAPSDPDAPGVDQQLGIAASAGSAAGPETTAAEIAPPAPLAPAGPQLVPKPAELKGPRVVRVEAPERLPPPRPRQGPPAAVPAILPDSRVGASPRRGKRVRGTGGEDYEAARARTANPRRRGVGSELAAGERLREWRERDMLERKERIANVTGKRMRGRRMAEMHRQTGTLIRPVPSGPKTDVQIMVPILLKDFCAAIGVPFVRLMPKLKEHMGALPRPMQMIDGETAEMLGLEFNITVHVTKAKTALEKFEEAHEARERKNPQPRPPVVTMLGHVDHGKTSLLDAIRATHVADGEAGGITQHIGASRIDRDGWHVTFLDTPGHKAFTEMRARGANMTDVVVLVVAAEDGVMPQTLEAINHAKAAGVPIVVALNKIDLPGADINKVLGQLAEHELTPTEWGGETDVIRTSATTGLGVDELIEHLSTLSEVLDLKADATVPAAGVVVEAQLREGRGAVTTVLVREGTLRTGTHIVCGPASGRVRSLIDSHGQRVKEAGPGTPVEVSGLDELPAAGDKMYETPDAPTAKEIAAQVRSQRREEALAVLQKPLTLEDLIRQREAGEIPELNLIIKADVDGSLNAIRQELGGIPSDKVTLNVLHRGVGAISEADVRLAEASSAIIVGFHVVAEDRARRLADQAGVEIRTYRVIYDVTDDVKKALEGLLKPLIHHEPKGKVEVKQIFNLSKIGTIAGCYVTEGVVARSHRIRVVRDGRLVREDAALASLRRFKNDAREVQNGLECGIRLEGFDDLKPGDILETYEATEVAQTL